MQARNFSAWEELIDDWPVRFTLYEVAGTFHCHVDNISPGAVFARASNADRSKAETVARDKATERLALTRRRHLPKQ